MTQIATYQDRLKALGISVKENRKPKRAMEDLTDVELRAIVLNSKGPTEETREKAMCLLEGRSSTPA